MLWLLVVLALRITHCEGKLVLKTEQSDTSIVSLSQCVLEGSRQFLISNFNILTYSFSKPSSLLVDLLEKSLSRVHRWSFLIYDGSSASHEFEEFVRANHYIIQVRTRRQLNQHVPNLKRLRSWYSFGYFLIISPTIFQNPNEVASEIIKYLWTENIVNVVVLLPDPSNTTVYNVYSRLPYSGKDCGRDHTSMTPMDKCWRGRFQNNTSWFRARGPQKYNNCLLRANYVPCPPYVVNPGSYSQPTNYFKNYGIEVNMLNMIASHFNLRIKYTRAINGEWGKEYPEKVTGDFTLLQNGSIDMTIGSYSKTYLRSVYFDVSYSYINEHLVWCVPHKPVLTGFKSLGNIIHTEVWVVATLFYFAITLAMWWCSSRSTRESTVYKSLANCLLMNFSLFLGVPVEGSPKTYIVRYLWFSLYVFCFQLSVMYCTYLTSILSTPNYVEKYGNIKAIYSHNLKTYFMHNTRRYFEGGEDDYDMDSSNDILLSVILDRWLNNSDLETGLKLLAARKDSAFCLPRHQKDFVLKYVLPPNDSSEIHCLNNYMVSYPIGIIMRKGFPLYPLFDDIILRIVDAGFIEKWRKDILFVDKRVVESTDFDKVSIKFKNLKDIFKMLLLGYALSGLVHLGGVIWFRRPRKGGAKNRKGCISKYMPTR